MKTPQHIRKTFTYFFIMMLVLFGFNPTVPSALAYPADATFTVTTNVDYDPGSADGICYNGVVEGCGLREAIVEANAASGNKNINFSSSLAGQTLYLNDSYGSLIVSGSYIIIDGYTGPSNYPPLINGSNLTGGRNVFEIQGNYIVLQNLVVRDGPANGIQIKDPSGSGYGSYNVLYKLQIYGNANNGIVVSGDAGGGGQHNTIQDSLIGAANWLQTTCPGDGNGWDGILISDGAYSTDIDSNTIVCNGNSGIYIMGTVSQVIAATTIQTNKIGTDGVNDMGNGLSGVADLYTSGTTIFNNVISGNGNDGVWLQGSVGAALTTNRIGVDQTGALALPNDYAGVAITDNANTSSIGSPTDANARNIISGNAGCGVEIDYGANNNVLDGNYIGLGGNDGMNVIPNGLAGVCMDNAWNNALSSSTATVSQYISGNTREGVYAKNSSLVIINPATLIGVAGNGSTPTGNQREGILLDEGTTNAIIFPGKVVYNGMAGIAVVGNTSTGNELGASTIGYNVGLAIDLGNDGHTANGSQTPPGPNNWMNYPEASAAVGGSFSGTTCPGCRVSIYQSIGDPTANSGGGVFLTSFYADPTTGIFNYTFPIGVLAVTITACTPLTYDCSEMSPSVVNDIVPSMQKIYLPMIKKP